MGNRMGTHNLASQGSTNFTRDNNGLNQYSSWTPSAIRQDDDMGGDWGSPGHANGVTMQEGWITASYNALNQPMAMWCSTYGSNFLWFGYDPLGRCVKRWMGSATGNAPNSNPATYYYYDNADMVQEGGSATSVARIYVHGAGVDQIVASQVSSGEWRYHHYDGQGNCILLTDTGGAIREQYDYDAFGMPYVYSAGGATLGAAAQWGNRFLFTGREWLSELRIYDYRARQYQPELGRFLEPDPQEFEAGDYNLYRYCHNDPVNKSDPTGLESVTASIWNHEMWSQSGSFLSSSQFDAVRQGTARLSWSASHEVEFRQGHSKTGAATGRSRVLAAQKSLYKPKNLRVFDKALAEVFGKSAIDVPAQTTANAPEIDTTLNAQQLYTNGAIINGRQLTSGRAAGATFKTESGYKIYIAPDAQRNPLRTYVHELSNKLSGELTGSMRTFGDHINPPGGDPDTGAAVERAMFGP